MATAMTYLGVYSHWYSRKVKCNFIDFNKYFNVTKTFNKKRANRLFDSIWLYQEIFLKYANTLERWLGVGIHLSSSTLARNIKIHFLVENIINWL